MIDCKGMANTSNDFFKEDKKGGKEPSEPDLWGVIFELAGAAPADHFQVQWMPSQLDEPHKVAERRRALQSGLIVEEDIQGNAYADKLADDGAKQHISNEMYVTARKSQIHDDCCAENDVRNLGAVR